MSKGQILSYSGDGVGFIFTIAQTQQVFQIVSLALTVFATLVSISFTIYMWFKKANEDGEITIEELDEIKKETEEKIKEMKENLK